MDTVSPFLGKLLPSPGERDCEIHVSGPPLLSINRKGICSTLVEPASLTSTVTPILRVVAEKDLICCC